MGGKERDAVETGDSELGLWNHVTRFRVLAGPTTESLFPDPLRRGIFIISSFLRFIIYLHVFVCESVFVCACSH